MDKLTNIKDLLDKYYEGTSTLKEEEQLMMFFNNNENLGELEAHYPEFAFIAGKQKLKSSAQLKNELLKNFVEDKNDSQYHLLSKLWMKVAATILWCAFAFTIGRYSNSANNVKVEVQELRDEIQLLRTSMIASIYQKPGASERIRAIQMAQMSEMPQEDVVQILAKALREDDNTNVRLASINVLSQHMNKKSTMDLLLQSLLIQDSPIVQMEILRALRNTDVEINNQILKDFIDSSDLDIEVIKSAEDILKSI